SLLHVAVTAETDDVLVENFVLSGVKPRRSHVRCYGHANRVAYALAERPGGAFHSGRVAKFRVPGRLRMQLSETFNFRHRQIIAAHVQPSVKEHAAVPGGEHEDIAINPARLVRIISQRMTKKHRADFCATEWKSKMP